MSLRRPRTLGTTSGKRAETGASLAYVPRHRVPIGFSSRPPYIPKLEGKDGVEGCGGYHLHLDS